MVAVTDAVAAALEFWTRQSLDGSLAPSTVAKYATTLNSFAAYTTARHLVSLGDLDQEVCRAWISSPVSAESPGSRARAGQSSAPRTRRGRLTVLRRAVSFWMSSGLLLVDTVPGDVFRSDGPLLLNPLTPLEVAQLRLAGRTSPRDWLRPAMVEASLAGASQHELAMLTVSSFDAMTSTLNLPGNRGASGRTASLSPGAVVVLSARSTDLARAARRRRERFDPTGAPLTMARPLSAYRPDSVAPCVAAHLRLAMRSAGVRRPGVRPSSILQFAANACYARNQRIEDVAGLLGLTSLDRAMTQIDPEWQRLWSAAVRAGGNL